jgi:REP element-mobilizing transposase RayT
MTESKTYYRRHLPHYHPEEATYHIVFRLARSLPLEAIERLQSEREEAKRELAETSNERERKRRLPEYRWRYFERFDSLLDRDSAGPAWLKEPDVAAIVKEALHYRDGKEYELLAYCIMPNHVHVVFSLITPDDVYVGRLLSRPIETDVWAPGDGRAKARPTFVTDILRLIKGSTARECNKVLGRTGPFWQHESYDHVIRDGDELERTIWYVLDNPVKAGFVQSWEQWPWSYVKKGLL